MGKVKVTISIDEELLVEFDARAEERLCNRSQLIEQLCRDEVSKQVLLRTAGCWQYLHFNLRELQDSFEIDPGAEYEMLLRVDRSAHEKWQAMVRREMKKRGK